eukprot:3696085-Rhodomonas_salina.1
MLPTRRQTLAVSATFSDDILAYLHETLRVRPHHHHHHHRHHHDPAVSARIMQFSLVLLCSDAALRSEGRGPAQSLARDQHGVAQGCAPVLPHCPRQGLCAGRAARSAEEPR